jgi:hypothetical protein
VGAQAIEEIARRTLFTSSPLTRGSGSPRVSLIPLIKQSEELRFPIHDFLGLQTGFSQLAGLLCSRFHIQQQAFEVGGPEQPLLCQKHELTQHMHQTERMLTVVQEVGAPTVVDRDPAELRQDADGLQGRLSSAPIDVIVREGGRAGHMHPVPFAGYREARFILMDHFALDQGRFDLLLHRGQRLRAAFDHLPDGPFTHGHCQQVPHHLTGTRQWQQLLFDQIDGNRSHLRAILDGGLHPSGKGSDGDVLAGRTLFLLGLIFAHQHTRRGHIQHLAPLSATGCHCQQVLLARFTALDLQLGDLIRGAGERQARSRVSYLPTRWLLALLAQAFWLASKPIGGGGQVAIMAIFGEPVLQGFQVLAQAAHLLALLLDDRVVLGEQGLLLLDQFVSLRQLLPQSLILFAQPDQFFFNRHALTLLALPPFGKSPADLGCYQSSWLRTDKQSSIFTYHLLEALEGKASLASESVITAAKIFDYVSEKVPETAKACYGNDKEQKPWINMRGERFVVALAPTRETTSGIAETSQPENDFDKLFDTLSRYTDELDLKLISRVVEVDFNRLDGNNHAARAYSLVDRLEKQDRLPELEKVLRDLLPRRFS